MSNTFTGLNLTTLAAGIVAPIKTNQNVGGLSGGSLPPTALYTQISTCATANSSLALPINPFIGQTYTIRNDGAAPCFLFPGSSVSVISSLDGALTAGVNIQVSGGGGVTQLIAISNNNAADTAAAGAAPNNPLVTWHVIASSDVESHIITAVTVTAFTASMETSGSVYSLPASGAIITMPSLATGKGGHWTFIMNIDNATNAWVVTCPAGTLNGTVIGGPTTGVLALLPAANASIAFSTGAKKGDLIDLYCDGVIYSVFARTNATTAAASFTIA